MSTRPRRRPRPALPPPGMRPKLSHDQVRDLAVCHLETLDAIATGHADNDALWNWAGSVYTWSRVAELKRVGLAEMKAQLELVASVIERYARTGRAVFTGPEYQLAKLGCAYMDDLAELVDRHTAIQSADWSERHLNTIRAAHTRRAARGATHA